MLNPTKKILKYLMEVQQTFEGSLVVSRYYSKEKAFEMFKEYEDIGKKTIENIETWYVGKPDGSEGDGYNEIAWVLSRGFELYKEFNDTEWKKREGPEHKSDYQVWLLEL